MIYFWRQTTDSSMIKFCNTVAPEVISKPKPWAFWRLMGRWELFICLFACVRLMLEAKQLTLPHPHPPIIIIIIIRNQLHCGWTGGSLFCFGLVTGSYLYFTRFTISLYIYTYIYIYFSFFFFSALLFAFFPKWLLYILSSYHHIIMIYI